MATVLTSSGPARGSHSETGVLGKVDVSGGAIAIGHPLGASGARLMTTLVHTMHRGGARYPRQTICEAGGVASSAILEPLS